jgi:hypothetical protein
MKRLSLFISLILLGMNMQGYAFAQQASTPAAAAPAPADAPAAAAPVDVVAESPNKAWAHGSIMYNEKAVGWVNEAIKSHEKGIPLDILLPAIFTPTPQAEKPVESIIESQQKNTETIVAAPVERQNFYLKSILYFGPGNWTLWLNDKKIVAGESYKQLEFIKVAREEVVILWKDVKMDEIAPDWHRYLESVDDTRFSNNKNIVYDRAGNNVAFILKPNQTLVSAHMDIVEGNPDKPAVVVNQNNSTPAGQQVPAAGPADKPELGEQFDSKNMKNYLRQINNLQSILGAITTGNGNAPVAGANQ